MELELTAWGVVRALVEERRRRMAPQGPQARSPDLPAATGPRDWYEHLLGLTRGTPAWVLDAVAVYLHGWCGVQMERVSLSDRVTLHERVARGLRWDAVARIVGRDLDELLTQVAAMLERIDDELVRRWDRAELERLR